MVTRRLRSTTNALLPVSVSKLTLECSIDHDEAEHVKTARIEECNHYTSPEDERRITKKRKGKDDEQ